jgi:hypothetical protein
VPRSVGDQVAARRHQNASESLDADCEITGAAADFSATTRLVSVREPLKSGLLERDFRFLSTGIVLAHRPGVEWHVPDFRREA